jgi:hypothetical protein
MNTSRVWWSEGNLCWTSCSHSRDYENCYLLDVTPCSPTDVCWRFGGQYCLYLQGRRIALLTACFLLCLHFVRENERKMFLRNPKMKGTCSSETRKRKRHVLPEHEYQRDIFLRNPKMKGTCSSETSANSQRTIRRYIPEDTIPVHAPLDGTPTP